MASGVRERQEFREALDRELKNVAVKRNDALSKIRESLRKSIEPDRLKEFETAKRKLEATKAQALKLASYITEVYPIKQGYDESGRTHFTEPGLKEFNTQVKEVAGALGVSEHYQLSSQIDHINYFADLQKLSDDFRTSLLLASGPAEMVAVFAKFQESIKKLK